jgi:hypothetical protein
VIGRNPNGSPERLPGGQGQPPGRKLTHTSHGLADAPRAGGMAPGALDADAERHAIDTTRTAVPATLAERTKTANAATIVGDGVTTIRARRRGCPANAGKQGRHRRLHARCGSQQDGRQGEDQAAWAAVMSLDVPSGCSALSSPVLFVRGSTTQRMSS